MPHNFSEKGNILSTNYEDTSRNISIFFADVDSLDRPMKDKICELIHAPKVADQRPAVSKYN